METPIVQGLAHDVTEQKYAERLAREASENLRDKVGEGERTIRELQLFRTLVDQCNDAIEVVDPETLAFSMSMRQPARSWDTAAKNFCL